MTTKNHAHTPCCHKANNKRDYLMWGSLAGVTTLYLYHLFFEAVFSIPHWYHLLTLSVFELVNTVWIGVLIGIMMVAILSKIPREFVISILGTQKGVRGILRATAAGVLLDLCSHGILMVGAKLYERGASIGQVMAFLLASPWNSFSLTLILITLIGLSWTLTFILLSMLVAIIVGLIFDQLVEMNKLPANPSHVTLPASFRFWDAARQGLANTRFDLLFFRQMFVDGVKESRMVLRWILFGIILASLIRALVPPDIFGNYFGPTFVGLALTIVAATIIEVCSEGSTPIAADLLTRANAPGNSFAFLMTGVSTDYTEIMVIKETTRSWTIALYLPLLTVPQVILIAWVINGLAL